MSSSPRTKGSSPPTLLLACLPGGGAETYASFVGRALQSKGWRVAILAAAPGVSGIRRDEVGGVERYIGPTGNLHYLLGRLVPPAWPLLGVIRGIETACLFAKMARSVCGREGALIDTIEGVHFSRFHRRRYAVTVGLHGSAATCKEHFGQPLTRQDIQNRKADRRQLVSADGVRAFNRYMADYVQSTLAVQLPRLQVFPHLVDAALFSESVSPAGSGPVRLLHVGRPDPFKGLATLLNASGRVLEACPDVTLDIVGWSESEPAFQTLQSGVEADLTDPRLRFLGRLPHEDVLRLYAAADICVIPSLWDNSPFTVYEAMAHGCAVVASAVGGIPELVADGDGGLLVPPKDSRAIAEAIIALASDRPFLQQQKLRSRQRALEVFEPGMILKKQMEFYTQAWGRRP